MRATELVLFLSLAFPAGRLPVQGAEGGSEPTREALLGRALDEVRGGRFEDALATAEDLRSRWPHDPVGALCAANAHQTMMRDYRIRDYEAAFEAMIAEAKRLAEAQVRQRPTAEAFFARGTARGYSAVHRARGGSWLPALKEALDGLHDMDRALELDPGYTDALLPLGLFDYWKSRKLSLGLGLFSGQRRRGIRRLETVWAGGRHMSVDAAYSLETIYLQERDEDRALQISDWLQERFPDNPIVLYHRALLLEQLHRPQDALAAWGGVLEGLHRFGRVGDGFLAECHLHRARLHELMGEPSQARDAVALAALHADRRHAATELEGPHDDFDAIRKQIDRMGERARGVGAGGSIRAQTEQ